MLPLHKLSTYIVKQQDLNQGILINQKSSGILINHDTQQHQYHDGHIGIYISEYGLEVIMRYYKLSYNMLMFWIDFDRNLKTYKSEIKDLSYSTVDGDILKKNCEYKRNKMEYLVSTDYYHGDPILIQSFDLNGNIIWSDVAIKNGSIKFMYLDGKVIKIVLEVGTKTYIYFHNG